MNMTSNRRQPPIKYILQSKTTSNPRQTPIKDNLKYKTTSNIKGWISKKPLIGSSLNFKLKHLSQNGWNGRTISIPRSLKIHNYVKIINPANYPSINLNKSQLLIEYLSNPCLDLPEILNLSSGDQTKIKNWLKWRQPKWKNVWMKDDIQWKKNSKY